MKKYIITISQNSTFEVELFAENADKASAQALQICNEGGGARDEDREWDSFEVESAEEVN